MRKLIQNSKTKGVLTNAALVYSSPGRFKSRYEKSGFSLAIQNHVYEDPSSVQDDNGTFRMAKV